MEKCNYWYSPLLPNILTYLDKKEAKDAGRETWYLSWALDLTKEERAKGKTVEVGRGFFETDRRRYSILDAPGHKVSC